MSVLSLILLAVSGVSSDSHSLRYYYTGVSAPGHGVPEFSKVGYVDDQHIDVYSSDVGRSIPVAPWLKKNERPEHWERMTYIAKEHEALFRDEVKIGMKRFNHTGGFHLLQVMHHCELRDDGSVVGYQQYRYDWKEFMYLDVQTATYIPTMGEAQMTAQRWNNPDVRMGERAKNYLEKTCVENLKRFITYGREELERRDPHQGSLLAVIIIVSVVTIIIILTSVIAGVFLYKKTKENYSAASTSDPSCDSDKPA